MTLILLNTEKENIKTANIKCNEIHTAIMPGWVLCTACGWGPQHLLLKMIYIVDRQSHPLNCNTKVNF